MVATIYAEVAIVSHTCGECGTVYGLGMAFNDARLIDGRTWYCPLGHRRHYGNSTEQQLDQAQRNLAWNREALATERAGHQRTANRLAGTQGALTRTKRRANAGVCLNCHRTFKDLVQHRAKKHPGLTT